VPCTGALPPGPPSRCSDSSWPCEGLGGVAARAKDGSDEEHEHKAGPTCDCPRLVRAVAPGLAWIARPPAKTRASTARTPASADGSNGSLGYRCPPGPPVQLGRPPAGRTLPPRSAWLSAISRHRTCPRACSRRRRCCSPVSPRPPLACAAGHRLSALRPAPRCSSPVRSAAIHSVPTSGYFLPWRGWPGRRWPGGPGRVSVLQRRSWAASPSTSAGTTR
jgi:hypothetical protein